MSVNINIGSFGIKKVNETRAIQLEIYELPISTTLILTVCRHHNFISNCIQLEISPVDVLISYPTLPVIGIRYEHPFLSSSELVNIKGKVFPLFIREITSCMSCDDSIMRCYNCIIDSFFRFITCFFHQYSHKNHIYVISVDVTMHLDDAVNGSVQVCSTTLIQFY